MKSFDSDPKGWILFADNHIVIACKQAGELTQPVNPTDPSLEKRVKDWIKKSYAKQGDVFCHVVHRLDKPVSGIVLFAKTSKALTRLNQMQKEKKFLKVYVACVEGVVKEDSGTLRHYLRHEEFHSEVVQPQAPKAQEAVLDYRVLERTHNTTRVAITLSTGRYHQIRAQFAAIGHPIVGDRKYGAARSYHPDKIMLHHAQMAFTHPVTQEQIDIHVDPQFPPMSG